MKETQYKAGYIIESVGKNSNQVQILKVFDNGYEWRYYPKQSENYYHTDYAGEFLLWSATSKLISIC